MNYALLDLEKKIEIECSSIVSFERRCKLTKKFQNKICSDISLNREDSMFVKLSGFSLAEMVSVLLWVQSKKIKLRHTERGNSTYFPTWSYNTPDPNITAERERDPCPLFIRLSNGSQFIHISNYSGHHSQPGNCLLREFHPVERARFAYYRPYRVNERMSLTDFDQEWYKLHLAMEIVRRKAETKDRSDPYADLPVTVGIVMATKLIRMNHGDPNTNLDILHRFVYNTGPATYHIFSKDDRVSKFNALTKLLVFP